MYMCTVTCAWLSLLCGSSARVAPRLCTVTGHGRSKHGGGATAHDGHLHGALQDTDSLEDALFLLGAHLFSDKWRMTNCLYQLSDLSHYDSRHRLSCFKNVQIIRTGIEELDTVICFLRSSSSIVQLSRICTPKTWTHKRRSVASKIRTT